VFGGDVFGVCLCGARQRERGESNTHKTAPQNAHTLPARAAACACAVTHCTAKRQRSASLLASPHHWSPYRWIEPKSIAGELMLRAQSTPCVWRYGLARAARSFVLVF
jgi:hypothetical protein